VHGGEAGQRTSRRGAGEAAKSRWWHGRGLAASTQTGNWRRRVELGLLPEGGDRIRCACTFRPSRMPSLSSSRKMKALTILEHGFKVLAFGLLPRARVETTSRHRRCVGDANVACRGGREGEAADWQWSGLGRDEMCAGWTVDVGRGRGRGGTRRGRAKGFYKPRDQERRTREQSHGRQTPANDASSFYLTFILFRSRNLY
jgi:hypothetical protein